jgi:hypothetical protein
MVEQATVNRLVVGSSPIRDVNRGGCIAQLVERWPFKPRVLGSSPSAPKVCMYWFVPLAQLDRVVVF